MNILYVVVLNFVLHVCSVVAGSDSSNQKFPLLFTHKDVFCRVTSCYSILNVAFSLTDCWKGIYSGHLCNIHCNNYLYYFPTVLQCLHSSKQPILIKSCVAEDYTTTYGCFLDLLLFQVKACILDFNLKFSQLQLTL